MVYKKVTTVAIILAVLFAILSGFVFGASIDVTTNDQVYDSFLKILVKIQRYSWPVVTLVFIYALYEYYVIGSEMLERKVTGQRLIVGIALFMSVLQALPLIYAFIVLK
ncbi:MAG: hypothetical protein IJ809_02405 [Clostridia bacterium]|nr:hypothetical protein [Clostridia bacterium]